MLENLMLSLLDLVLTIPQIVFTLLFYVAEPLLWVAIPLFALEQLLNFMFKISLFDFWRKS
tara:strand:+ start:463 stop:645 length:183 start_codon:yes stop_codon:yes gene_type:complete